MFLKYLFILVAFVTSLFSGEEFLPNDDDVTIGKLENGFTYYILENSCPKETASLYLVVKVGSLHEEEDERGLAHFLEHMLFRGGKHFKDKEAIQYLESIGASFGPHVNAYTNYDETVYQLDIPISDPEALKTSLLILSDMVSNATIEDELVEIERGVIIDEANLRSKSASARICEQEREYFLEGSRHLKRAPIGLKEVVQNSPAQKLRDFYSKWYVPERMALIAVGDFDSAYIESLTQELFSELTPSEIVLEEPSKDFKLPTPGSTILLSDPETSEYGGSLLTFKKLDPSEELSFQEVHSKMVGILIQNIFQDRLNVASKIDPYPFISCYTISTQYIHNYQMNEIYFHCFEDRPLKAFEKAYEEIVKLKKYGPTEEEISSQREKFIQPLLISIANQDLIPHSAYVNIFHSNFTRDQKIYSPIEMLKLMERIAFDLEEEDFREWIEDHIDLDDLCYRFVSPKADLVTSDDIHKCMISVQTKEIESPQNKDLIQLICSPLLDEKIDLVPSHHITLPNGLDIYFVPSDLENKCLYTRLIAKGGQASIPMDEIESTIPSCRLLSGIANLNQEDFYRFLNNKLLNLYWTNDNNYRILSLNGPSSKAEEIFKTIRSIFLEKNFDSSDCERFLEKRIEGKKSRANNPYHKYYKKLEEEVHSGHPLFKDFDYSLFDEKRSTDAFDRAFTDPQEFSMVIVGDFDPEILTQLAGKYLNFAPNEMINLEEMTSLPLGTFPKETVSFSMYEGKETHSLSNFVFCAESTSSFLTPLENIIKNRLIDILRREEGGTYNVSVSSSSPFDPNFDEVYLDIDFSSEPERAKMLQELTLSEIEKFVQEGPTVQEIENEKQFLIESHKKSTQTNSFLIGNYTSHILYDTPLEDFAEFCDVIEEDVTIDSVWEQAKLFFENSPYVQSTLYPKGYSD